VLALIRGKSINLHNAKKCSTVLLGLLLSTVMLQVRCQSKFVSCKISDFFHASHVRMCKVIFCVSHKHAEKTDD